MSNEKTCIHEVTRVVGRNEFQSRTTSAICGKPVAEGDVFCPAHREAVDAKKEKARARQAYLAEVARRKNNR